MRIHMISRALLAVAVVLVGAGCKPTPAPTRPEAALEGQTWYWVSTAVDAGSTVTPAKSGAFTVTFGTEGRVTGKTDCNSYFGTYEAKADGSLTFPGPFGATKMFCEGSQEAEFLGQLEGVTAYDINDSRLSLTLTGGGNSMLFSPSNGAAPEQSAIEVTPVEHAGFLLDWGDAIVVNDPTGGAEKWAGHPVADLVLVSDIHGDHLNEATLEAVVGEDTVLVAPKAVADALTGKLKDRVTLLANGETKTVAGITVTGVPMYNLPETADSRHTKGRGNGYVLEKDGYRVYVAGDTAGIPEMRALEAIDMAFIPMNGPTMPIEEAADAVLDFAPGSVYPYHYRSQATYSDVAAFASLVNAGNPDILVVQLDWYPAAQ